MKPATVIALPRRLERATSDPFIRDLPCGVDPDRAAPRTGPPERSTHPREATS